jgi:hypothetical protein
MTELQPDHKVEDFALGLLAAGFFVTVGSLISAGFTGSVLGGLVSVLLIVYLLGLGGVV